MLSFPQEHSTRSVESLLNHSKAEGITQMANEEKGLWGFLSYPWMWIMMMVVEIVLMPVNWFCYAVNLPPVNIETPFIY